MTITLQPVPLTGCRHDVLGHALKAIGILRAVSTCAALEDCDPDVEGWWSPDDAAFMIRSARYPDAASLVKFFAEKYRPTPVIAAWNKSGGVPYDIEVVVSCSRAGLSTFRADHENLLEEVGCKKNKKPSKPGILKFALTDATRLHELEEAAKTAGLVLSKEEKQRRGKPITEIALETDTSPLERFQEAHSDQLRELGLGTDTTPTAGGELKFSTDSTNEKRVADVVAGFNGKHECAVQVAFSIKDGKKDRAIPSASDLLKDDKRFQQYLELARGISPRFIETIEALEKAKTAKKTHEAKILQDELRKLFFEIRDQLPDGVAESFDALCALHISQQNDNPLFVRRGRPGDKVNADIFLNFWDYFTTFRNNPSPLTEAALFGGRIVGSGIPAGDRKGKGTPFFPDAIKCYNQGTDWVTEVFPFCPLDYLLAVEGALAMRGATSKTLSARSRSRAAFPFVFEGTETMTDDDNKNKGLSISIWLPIWIRPTSFTELQSFILDSQARLPSKDCRFSSDFARAIRCQGVDAGFFAFQEFQFRLKGASVPWTKAGDFLPCETSAPADVLNELLSPLDQSRFLDQFIYRSPAELERLKRTSSKKKTNLHPHKAPVLDAIEKAAAEPSSEKVVEVLAQLASLNIRLTASKQLREDVDDNERVTFVPPLRCDDWSVALQELESDPEFEIARALASIRGHEKQPDGTYSEVEPFQGSLLPLRRGQNVWYLPDPVSPQAVWTGIDLARDLSSVLARRVLDSAKDIRPSVVGACTARLTTILRFLQGEFDDRRIARLVEALSLIDWRFSTERIDRSGGEASDEERLDPVPIAYAAARCLLEVACDMQRAENGTMDDQSGPRAKVQRTVALLSRQEPRMAAAATEDALRRLAIVGVPNPYSEESRREKPKLSGRDVVQVAESLIIDVDSARRLAAAALIPLGWRDRWTLFRSITLPQTIK